MYLIRKQLTFIFVFSLLIFIVHSFRLNNVEHSSNEKEVANDQQMNDAQFHALKQILNRRSLYDPAFSDSWSNYFERKRNLYDPAFSDSWSNYFEKKRNLFDPAYSEWANSFKRSDE